MTDLTGLVLRALADDLDAYNEIVRRFQGMAVTYAYSILGDYHLAEDAAQEAFIAAYTDLSKLRTPEAFPGWFRGIVRNRCSRFTRRKKPALISIDEADVEVVEDKTPADLLEHQEDEQRVQAILSTLPDSERSVVVLYYIGQFTQARVASFLDLPESTVVNRLRSSKAKLREEWIRVTQEALQSNSKKFADGIHRQLQTLQTLHEKLCLMTTDLFSSTLSQEAEVEITDVDQVTYAEFICGLALRHPITGPSMTVTFRLEPLEGRMTLDMSFPLAYAVLYGGEKIPEETETRWKSDWLDGDEVKEMNLFLNKRMFEHLMSSWETTLKVSYRDGEYAESASSLLEYPDYPSDPDHKERMDLPRPSDRVFRVCMSVKSGDLSEEVALCYPAQSLQSVLQ